MTREKAIEMLTAPEWQYDEHCFSQIEIDAIRTVCNPWHKSSEELPMYEVDVLVAYNGSTMDCCFNHRSSNPEVKTTQHDWCDVGYEGEPTHWMYIPELPKED